MPLIVTVIKQNSKIKIALSLININEYFGGNLSHVIRLVDLGQGGEGESQINGDLRQEWLITALLAERE